LLLRHWSRAISARKRGCRRQAGRRCRK
jgi:hypothetical protein